MTPSGAVAVENVDVHPDMVRDALEALAAGVYDETRRTGPGFDPRIRDCILTNPAAPGAVRTPTITFASATSRPDVGADLAAMALACLEGWTLDRAAVGDIRCGLRAAFAAWLHLPGSDERTLFAQCASPWAPLGAMAQHPFTGAIERVPPDPDIAALLPPVVLLSTTIVDGREAIGISPVVELVATPGPDAMETLRVVRALRDRAERPDDVLTPRADWWNSPSDRRGLP